MCEDCDSASHLVRTGTESNLRTEVMLVLCQPATLIASYEFRTYGFSVADITGFTTLSKNVGDKTAVAAKLAKRTCLGYMSATFQQHMQLRSLLIISLWSGLPSGLSSYLSTQS